MNVWMCSGIEEPLELVVGSLVLIYFNTAPYSVNDGSSLRTDIPLQNLYKLYIVHCP